MGKTVKEYREARSNLKNDIPYIKAVFGQKCAYCGSRPNREDLEVHRIIPLADGGKDVFKNVIPLCHECHQKAHKGEIDWVDLFKLSLDEFTVHLLWADLCSKYFRRLFNKYHATIPYEDADALRVTDTIDDDIKKLQVEMIIKGEPFYYHGSLENIYPIGVDVSNIDPESIIYL